MRSREETYAKEGDGRVPRTRSTARCGCSPCCYGMLYVLNSLLLVSVGALSIWLWLRRGGDRSARVAVVIGLVLRLLGHVAVDHVGDVGAVREHRHGAGRHHVDLAAARWSRTSRAPRPSSSRKGEIAFEHVGFHYGKGKGVIEDLSLDRQAGREGRPRRPLRRRQVDARQPAAALLRPRERPHPDRRQDIADGHAGLAARADRHGHAGHLAAAPLGARQHPLRPARRERGR